MRADPSEPSLPVVASSRYRRPPFFGGASHLEAAPDPGSDQQTEPETSAAEARCGPSGPCEGSTRYMTHFLASEGGYQSFVFSGTEKTWLVVALVTAIFGLGVGLFLMRGVLAADTGHPEDA